MKTNRRRLLQSAAATGAGLALGGSALLNPRNRVSAQTTGSVDNLRISMQALPPQLDPQTDAWIVMARVYSMMFDSLIAHDWANGGVLVPALATDWEQVDDTTIDFTLRDGVVFQDGTPMTANDVKFTLNRALAGDSKLYVTGQFPIAEIVVQDELHLTIKTDGPRGDFLEKLASTMGSIVPEAYFNEVGYAEFQKKPLGTGPYRITEYVPDQHLLFDVNEQYWGGVSAAKQVTLTGIPEVSTRVAALLNDEVDLIMDLPPDQVETVTNAGGFAVSDVSPAHCNVFQIVGIPPTDKKEIRQALNLGFDRQAIVEQLLNGHGVWPTGILSVLDPLYTERPPLPYDPDKAKALMESVGYAGEEIKLAFDTPNYYPLEQEWTSAIVGMWNEIGLNVTMTPVSVDERVLITPDSGWNLFTSGASATNDVLALTYGSPTGYIQTEFNTAPAGTFDELNATVAELERSVDLAKRTELAKQAYDFLEDYVMAITLFTINRISAAKPGITFQEDGAFGIDLRAKSFSIA